MHPPAELEFRFAAAHDAEALASLRARLFREIGGPGPDDALLCDALVDYFTANLASGDFVAALAVTGGAIIATSGLVWHQHPPSAKNICGREAYITNMFTLPEWRGRGIAAELLRRLLDVVRERGGHRVILRAMPKARDLYTRAGFQAGDSEMRLDLHRPSAQATLPTIPIVPKV